MKGFKHYLLELVTDNTIGNNPANGDDVSGAESDSSFYNPSPDVDTLGQQEEQNDDPNFQGVIRHIPGAHLVYKRQTDEGTFDELWIYKIGPNNSDAETNTRREILAGSDIEPGHTQSKDGKQQMDLWSVGNVQFLNLTGLPN